MRYAALAVLVFAVVAGCNEDPGADNGRGDHLPAPLPAATSICGVTYPCPPYGVQVGSTIANDSFEGFPNQHSSRSKLETITLADFYNPHAGDDAYKPADPAHDDRLYPEGSPYVPFCKTDVDCPLGVDRKTRVPCDAKSGTCIGAPKPTALLIDIASVWCGPCNGEAKDLLPNLYAKYNPCGGEFLFQLAQGAAPNTPATISSLHTWTTAYVVHYPATIDPGQQLVGDLQISAFPNEIILDTRTMKIVTYVAGLPDDTLWSTFASVIGDESCTGSN